jgi:glycosyltransferase involved in cell wall biosynthesis
MQSEDSGLVVHRAVRSWGWRFWSDIAALDAEHHFDVLNIQYQAAAYRMHPAINVLPWWLRRRGGPPVVVTFHDLRVPYLFPKAGPLRWQAVLALARWSDGVIATNREDELRLEGARVQTPTVRIPIGSNIAPRLPAGYRRSAWRARWRVDDQGLLLGYFGFLNERKGGEELIQTLAALVARGIPAQLLLIGGRVGTSDSTNARYAERVDDLIAAQGLTGRVHRTGFVSPEEVSASLMAVDACVLPYREGASLRHGSLHACLAHGRPIVTTLPAVDTPELQEGENLLMVPPGDVEALASGVMRLNADAGLRARLEAGARMLAGAFTWERIAARTADFLGELVA